MTPTPLEISIPHRCSSEIRWTCSVVFEQLLGIGITFIQGHTEDIILAISGKSIRIKNVFFQRADDHWLGKNTLPNQTHSDWDSQELGLSQNLLHPILPVLLGAPTATRDSEGNVVFDFDILGTIFLCLSRYEECVLSTRDLHDRFPASASFMNAHNLIERPLVDEYTEVLWNALKLQCPDLARKETNPRVHLSCDVDHLRDPAAHSLPRLLKRVASISVGKSDSGGIIANVRRHLDVKLNGLQADSYQKSIICMMDDAEQYGHHLTFFFIPKTTDAAMDGDNRPEHMHTQEVMQAINERGHEIGVHPGYQTYMDPTQFKQSISHFREQLDVLGITHAQLGSRQHYLRWATDTTPRLCEDNGVFYDSSLGFAQRAGFRCGTSHDFSMYDLKSRVPLSLLQRPLILMDATLLRTTYNKSACLQDDVEHIKILRKQCLHYGGNFNVLWHNSSFTHPRTKSLYAAAIK